MKFNFALILTIILCASCQKDRSLEQWMEMARGHLKEVHVITSDENGDAELCTPNVSTSVPITVYGTAGFDDRNNYDRQNTTFTTNFNTYAAEEVLKDCSGFEFKVFGHDFLYQDRVLENNTMKTKIFSQNIGEIGSIDPATCELKIDNPGYYDRIEVQVSKIHTTRPDQGKNNSSFIECTSNVTDRPNIEQIEETPDQV